MFCSARRIRSVIPILLSTVPKVGIYNFISTGAKDFSKCERDEPANIGNYGLLGMIYSI